MPAATATEWLTAASIGTASFAPGALLILSLDHDFSPVTRLVLVPVRSAADAGGRAWARARLTVAALLLLAASQVSPAPKEAVR